MMGMKDKRNMIEHLFRVCFVKLRNVLSVLRRVAVVLRLPVVAKHCCQVSSRFPGQFEKKTSAKYGKNSE